MSEKENLERVRRIVKDTIHEILDEEVWDPLTEAFTGLEAICVQLKHRIGTSKGIAVREETFAILKWEKQQGNRIGEYEVAYKANNIPDKFQQAYNILNKSNATISSRYHGEGYEFAYWLYDQDKIYKQKLKRSA